MITYVLEYGKKCEGGPQMIAVWKIKELYHLICMHMKMTGE